MKIPVYVRIAIFLLILVLTGYLLVKAQVFLASITLGLLLSILLLPVAEKFEKLHVSRLWSAAFTVTILAVSISLIIYFISAELLEISDGLDQMTDNVENLDENIENIVYQRLGIEPEQQNLLVNKVINQFLQNSSQFLSKTVSTTANIVTGLIFIPFCIFFFLYYRFFLKKHLYRAVSSGYKNSYSKIMHSIRYKISSYLSGLVIVISIIAVLDISALLIIGIKYPVFWGTVAALLTIIPYVGVFIGSAMPIMFAFFTTDSLFYPIAIFFSFWLIQIIEGNLITPNIVGDKVELNPFVIIIAIFIGGSLWGPVGMVLAVPYIAILKVIMENIDSLYPYSKFLGMPEYAVDDKKLIRKIKKKLSAKNQ